jgi:hypothetical protein
MQVFLSSLIYAAFLIGHPILWGTPLGFDGHYQTG